MVRCNDADRSILQSGNQCLTMFFGPQRRVDFQMRIESREQIVGQQQVVGSHIGSDFQSACAGLPYFLHAPQRGERHQMDSTFGVFNERNIPPHHDFFGRGRNAAQSQNRRNIAFVHHAASGKLRHARLMQQRTVPHAGVLQRPPHDF